MVVSAPARAAPLSDAEAAFLDQLVTAAAVVGQRCVGFEADGAGGVQLGARLLGSPNAAMAMIDAFSAAIKAHDGESYDPGKFRPKCSTRPARRSSACWRIWTGIRKAPAPATAMPAWIAAC